MFVKKTCKNCGRDITYSLELKGCCSYDCMEEYNEKKNKYFTVNVSLKDVDIFEAMLNILKDMTFDEDIPKLKRLEYYNRVLEIIPEVDKL